jgi:hypothetical protein
MVAHRPGHDPLLAGFVGAQLVVRVQMEAIFPNCPRYVHTMQMVERVAYAPCEGHTPPVPEWKTRPAFRDVLPPSDPASPRKRGARGRTESAAHLLSEAPHRVQDRVWAR